MTSWHADAAGTIPAGFPMKDGHGENICPYCHEV